MTITISICLTSSKPYQIQIQFQQNPIKFLRFKFIFLSEIKIYAKFNFIYLYACQNVIKFEFRIYTKNMFLAISISDLWIIFKKCQIQRQSILKGAIVSQFLCQILTQYTIGYQIWISKTVGPLCSPQFKTYGGPGVMVPLASSPITVWPTKVQHTNKRHCLLLVIGSLKYHFKFKIYTSCFVWVTASRHQAYILCRILIQGS